MAKTKTASKAQQLVAEVNAALKGNVLRMGSHEDYVVTHIPTGLVPIDDLLGGGLARGRTIEFFGDYSTLKSYIGLRAIAEAQAMDGVAALVDTEHAFDPEWAKALGVDVDNLIIPDIETGEEAVDATELLIRQQADIVVWDSVAATLPKSEAERRAVDKQQQARLAALMSQAFRKLTAANSKTALMFINQTRQNVGQMFGSPETTPGGKALPFYASQRIALRKAGKLRRDVGETKETYGFKVRAVLEKSKLNVPHRDIVFTFDLDMGDVDLGDYYLNIWMADGTAAAEKKGGKKTGWYIIAGEKKKYREADIKREVLAREGYTFDDIEEDDGGE